MSALTDLFAAMANKIRSKTGTATTYTPSEMVSDGIDDVYDAGVASATTPITPSNSSPASMTANTGYKPTANGYAIASYDSITPSSAPESVASGDIVKIGGSGVIVDAIPTPTSITPSNSSPVALTADTPVNPTSGGYAIASYDDVTPSSTAVSVAADDIVKIGGSGVIVDSVPTPTSITPSNVSPVALTANTAVNPTASGYAIAAYSSVTPSNSSPVVLTSGDIDKMGGNGYAIESFNTITPSNATPVSLADGDMDRINGSGYAIASYNTKTPSNSTPVSLTSGEFDKMGGNGYAITSYSTVTPSGNPTSVSSGDIVKIDGGFNDIVVDMSDLHEIRGSNIAPEAMNGGSLAKVWGNDPTVVTGYAIASYTPVTPSSTPTSISAGDMVQVNGSGAIVDAVTSITPSNTSPVSLSSGSIYKTGGNGYAISSYTSVTPSSTQTAVSSGDIVKIGGSGVIVDSVPTPTSLTPSNSSPATITSGGLYQATAGGKAVETLSDLTASNADPVPLYRMRVYRNVTGSGSGGTAYAIESYSDVTPSNSSPVSLSSGSIYKTGGSGYAIASYSSKTPSDTSPASVSSGAIIKASSAGYLVKNAPIDFSKPDVISHATMSGNTTRTIAVTKMPRYIIYGYSRTNANGYGGIFFIDVARDMYGSDTYGGSGFASSTETSGTSGRVTSVTSSSVTVAAGASYEVRTYVAIWY